MIDEKPTRMAARRTKVMPVELPGELQGTAESGAYIVQPAAAGLKPPVVGSGRISPVAAKMQARKKTQYEAAFRTGKAMSWVPTCSGIRKFPKAPTRIGMTTKKIISRPWTEVRPVNCSGFTEPRLRTTAVSFSPEMAVSFL